MWSPLLQQLGVSPVAAGKLLRYENGSKVLQEMSDTEIVHWLGLSMAGLVGLGQVK